jgi:modulator of FtsH protease
LAAYDPEQWTDLFVAVAGAGAALAGLVFVAVSINIERILGEEGLPSRALETVLTLLIVVLVAIAGLIPGQSATALGIELLALSAVFGIFVARLSWKAKPPPDAPRTWLLGRVLVQAAAVIPMAVGSISLLAECGGGLYWIAAAIIFAIVGAVANAWVLLVEILR